jgi:hypothetical protein
MNITLYLDELSRVFFKTKETLYDKGPWWLSTFYRFCIQSFVRTTLMELMGVSSATKERSIAASQYLYLPIRLFIATSSSFRDPLLPAEALQTSLLSL